MDALTEKERKFEHWVNHAFRPLPALNVQDLDDLVGSVTHASDDTDKEALLDSLSFISEL